MHISDGILEFKWVIIWYLIASVFLIIGIRSVKRKNDEDPSYMPMLALMGASVFVISVWHIPVPVTGSSSHPVGTPMAAILMGPFATVVISSIAIFFHAFLGHGGITTLGANIVSMGIAGTFAGYLTYRAIRTFAPLWIAVGMAGFVGDIATYMTTALELALSINPGSVASHWTLYSIGFIPTQLPLAAAEFVFTASVIRYIEQRRPDILRSRGVINA